MTLVPDTWKLLRSDATHCGPALRRRPCCGRWVLPVLPCCQVNPVCCETSGADRVIEQGFVTSKTDYANNATRSHKLAHPPQTSYRVHVVQRSNGQDRIEGFWWKRVGEEVTDDVLDARNGRVTRNRNACLIQVDSHYPLRLAPQCARESALTATDIQDDIRIDGNGIKENRVVVDVMIPTVVHDSFRSIGEKALLDAEQLYRTQRALCPLTRLR